MPSPKQPPDPRRSDRQPARRPIGRSLLASLVLHGVAFGGGLAWWRPWELGGRGTRLVAHVVVEDAPQVAPEEPAAPPPPRSLEPEFLREPGEPGEPVPRTEPHDPLAEPETLPDEAPLAPMPDALSQLVVARGRVSLELRPPEPEPVAALEPEESVDPDPAAHRAIEAAAVVTAAEAVFAPEPHYPRASVRLGEEGSVLLEIRVAPDGKVVGAAVLQSSGYARLDDAALEAVADWRFRPATRAGVAVEARFPHRLTFRIAEAR